MKLKGLYAITHERLTPYDVILQKVEESLAGGARIVQLRDKHARDSELYDIACSLKELCHGYGAIFIINDRVELARATGADGVHIGKDDTEYAKARQILGPEAIIGVSCYNELDKAIDAARQGADYVAFGSFFPSPTKPEAVRAPLEIISQAKAVLDVPVCCIGGITSENVPHLVAKGADMAAVISDLWNSSDIRAKAQEFAKAFEPV